MPHLKVILTGHLVTYVSWYVGNILLQKVMLTILQDVGGCSADWHAGKLKFYTKSVV
jgi:hypothetical protein